MTYTYKQSETLDTMSSLIILSVSMMLFIPRCSIRLDHIGMTSTVKIYDMPLVVGLLQWDIGMKYGLWMYIYIQKLNGIYD